MSTEDLPGGIEIREAVFEDYERIIQILPQVSSSCIGALDSDTVQKYFAMETFRPIVAIHDG